MGLDSQWRDLESRIQTRRRQRIRPTGLFCVHFRGWQHRYCWCLWCAVDLDKDPRNLDVTTEEPGWVRCSGLRESRHCRRDFRGRQHGNCRGLFGWRRHRNLWPLLRRRMGLDEKGGSVDGNTVIVGGYSDGGGTETNGLYYGAAWVWTRKGGVWTQQGPKLVASDAVNGKYGSYQGAAVALSADGNTAIIGGPEDDTQIGAAWIWTRSGETWTQQGPKLVGSPVPGLPAQGNAVALSADGNTAIIGAADR